MRITPGAVFAPRAGENGKNINVQLPGGRIIALVRRELCGTFFVFKKLCIRLHGSAQRHALRHMQLLHPDGKQIGAEFLAVKLNVQQPVVTYV